jgi:hypothetical protein
MKLANALKIGYKSKEYQEQKMAKRGYVRDNDLSSVNHQAYYNKKKDKLLFNVKGTNPYDINDYITDGYLAFGGIKNTSRYKEADKMLTKAKEKYNPTSVSVIGHSLGGSIAGLIASKNDHVITLDKGATIGTRTRSNEDAYRTSGDVISILNSGSKRMITLENPNSNILKNGIIGQALQSHDIKNIKDKQIFI